MSDTRNVKAGLRVMPFGSDRYFIISRTDASKAYYRYYKWEGDFNCGEERSIPIRALKETELSGLKIWVQAKPLKKVQAELVTQHDKIYDISFNYHGETNSFSTEAPSEAKAIGNMAYRMAKKYRVSPGLIRTYMTNSPSSYKVVERK